ncbi:aldo/keto reductase [Longirhabdus pacifica]|uniref:aldo/keto reductase n=1 Tax=Longirhabdus pacifica TaxID=2305227 RepID=UPI0010092B8C|nr:aldo/keto reductase [Longirhabdus pacifica]
MKYRRLGRSGIAVSELCLGTMTFGNTTNEEDSIQMIQRFMEYGGNFIDTADVYVSGKSEEIVGKALKHRRDEMIIATKVRFPITSGVNDVGLSRKHILNQVENSLKRLQTDYIDLYQMHTWDHITPIEETIRTLDDLVTSGKVRYIGCSNYLAWQMMKSLAYSDFHNKVRFVSIQPQYSLIEREMDREVFPLCNEEEVGVLPWSPLAGGFLTGKYDKNIVPTEGRLSALKGESTWKNRFTDKNFLVMETLQHIGQEINKTPAQIALNWLLGRKGVTSPIFGARTLEQFEENMGALSFTLSPEHWNKLDEVSSLSNVYPYRFIDRFKREM